MQFVQISGMQGGVQPLSSRLIAELQSGKSAIWVVTGGSNIELSVAAMQMIPTELTEKLQIFLSDERYGAVGHTDSNAQQLLDAGFESKAATFFPVLAEGLSLEETCARYEHLAQAAFEKADVIIGQLGMGPDGHIAGILPGSVAVDAAGFAVSYSTETHTRITLTPVALQQISAAYLFAFGDSRKEALIDLQQKNLSITQQPAQLLKSLPEVYVYNDQISDNTEENV